MSRRRVFASSTASGLKRWARSFSAGAAARAGAANAHRHQAVSQRSVRNMGHLLSETNGRRGGRPFAASSLKVAAASAATTATKVSPTSAPITATTTATEVAATATAVAKVASTAATGA